MSDWTLESLYTHFTERFRQHELAAKRIAEEFSQYRIQSNEWRSALRDAHADREGLTVTRAEWSATHRELRTQTEADIKVLSERIDVAWQHRNGLNDRLIKIESRAGYVSLVAIGSTIALLLSLGEIAYRVINHGG
jgi:hypothetical protein